MPDAPDNTRLHWNYFLALEKDLEAVSRYIEFCPDNFNTYSIELAHLLFSAASEVDTLAKCVCATLDPKAKPGNINQYRGIIKAAEDREAYPFVIKGKPIPPVKEDHKHRLSALKVYIPRYSLELVPWESWAKDRNPDWWDSYNKVKHERNHYFNKATLNNALHALAALLALNYIYRRYELSKPHPQDTFDYRGKSVTRSMVPASAFLRFARNFYENPIADLGKYISNVSRDVDRLSDKLSDKD